MSLPDPYYQDDHATIYHGDCLEIMSSLTYDVVVTDPPYGIDWSVGDHRKSRSKAHDGIANDKDTSVRDEALALSGDRPIACFGSLYLAPPEGTKHIAVWKKPCDAGVVGSTIGMRRDIEAIYFLNVWPTKTARWSSVVESVATGMRSYMPAGAHHPHAKPEDIMARLIEMSEHGTVLDPFMGSGTTLRAAKDLGRKSIGIELEEKYCEIAAKRLAQEVLEFA